MAHRFRLNHRNMDRPLRCCIEMRNRTRLPAGFLRCRSFSLAFRHLQNEEVTMADLQMPGSLAGAASIEIHTRQGWRLVYSRRSDGSPSPMTGLLRFAARMNTIWAAAQADDPFADWFLEKTYHAIETARMEIGDMHRMLATHFQHGKKGVNVEMAASSTPVSVPLQFSTPYGFMGAYLVSECDALIRACYTCRHVGLISNAKNEQNIRRAMRLVLRAFELQREYRFHGVTREDARAANAKWNRAVEEMGSPPPEIVAGRRPRVSPYIGDDASEAERVEEAEATAD